MEEDETLLKLRGGKIRYFLMKGKTKLLDASQYPFKSDQLPIQCNMAGEKGEPLFAYTSGNRSLVFPVDGHCFKGKATGIPSGILQPRLHEGNIFTYHLTNATIGVGDIIWGFSSIEEAEREIYWMSRARELDLPVTEPIGMGIYENVHVVEFRNQIALYEYMNEKDEQTILKDLTKRSRGSSAACLFCRGPTDARVDEILYGFLFPRIGEVLDLNDCRDYLRWLGSSCAYNLRMHHDNGIMHGTISKPPYQLTNSHLANHLVSESGTWMTDYHMANDDMGERLMREEVFALSTMLVPLPSARRIAMERFGKRGRPLYLQMFDRISSDFTQGSIFGGGQAVLRKRGERLTEALLNGIQRGYQRREVLHIESKLKRDIFRMLVELKERLWHLYELPEGMQRDTEYVNKIMATRKISAEKISEELLSIERARDKAQTRIEKD